MKVYHGSYTEIDVIDLSFCEMGKDFGQGFYVTNLREQAEIWANKKGKRKRKDGVVTEFEYNENLCRIMKLKTMYFNDYSDEWLEFVVLNRKNETGQQAHGNVGVNVGIKELREEEMIVREGSKKSGQWKIIES